MKRLLAILAMCLLIFSVDVPDIQANKGKAVRKIIQVVSKGTKRAPKRAVPARSTPARRAPRVHPSTTVKCPQCNGQGGTRYWNLYTKQYHTTRCPKCNGTGRVSRY